MTRGGDLDSRLSELMRRGHEGDQAAYEEVLTESSRLILALLRKRFGSLEAADDILQETLISIHKARHTFDPDRSYLAWMYAISKYRAADFFRRWSRISNQEISISPEDCEKLVSEFARHRSEKSRDLGKEVTSLPDKQKTIIRDLKVEGLSVKEVSQKLGMSESAVKVAAHRAYKRLRKKLEEVANEND